MEQHTIAKIHITRGKHWHCQVDVQYPGWPNNSTHCSYSTLSTALYKCVDMLYDINNCMLVELSVKEKPMKFSEAYNIIEKALKPTRLDYKLDDYYNFLLNNQEDVQCIM